MQIRRPFARSLRERACPVRLAAHVSSGLKSRREYPRGVVAPVGSMTAVWREPAGEGSEPNTSPQRNVNAIRRRR